MKNKLNKIKMKSSYLCSFVLWVLAAIVVGVVGGFIGGAFHKCLDAATELRGHKPWLLYFLPIAGLAIVFIYSIFKKKGKLDTNRVIEASRDGTGVPGILSVLIFFSTAVTQLFGGSAGREGAALQLGGSIGYNIGKLFRFNDKSLKTAVMCGMASVFSALFGTPVTAAVFSLEIACVGAIKYGAFMPCIISSAVGYFCSSFMGNSAVRFPDINFPQITCSLVIKTLVLTCLAAVVSVLFCIAIKYFEIGSKKIIANGYIRVFIGGSVVVLMTMLLKTTDYNGAGMEIVNRSMEGIARPEAFALKILFTAITLAAGYKGGEIVPTLFIGSTFGCFMATLMNLDPGFGAAVGFVALFCGVTNCPISSLFLAIEVFGGEYLLIFAGICAVSYVLSGYFGLYKSQKILFSKVSNEEINLYCR